MEESHSPNLQSEIRDGADEPSDVDKHDGKSSIEWLLQQSNCKSTVWEEMLNVFLSYNQKICDHVTAGASLDQSEELLCYVV